MNEGIYIHGLEWYIVGIAVLGWCVTFFLQWRRKRRDGPFTIWLDGFPPVHFPSTADREKAESVTLHLSQMYDLVWYNLSLIYRRNPRGGLPVTEIFLRVPPQKKPVEWRAPNGPIHLEVDEDMGTWFARELHNVFRCVVFGISNIYPAAGEESRAYKEAVQFIEKQRICPPHRTGGDDV